jgi:hypothetical protein
MAVTIWVIIGISPWFCAERKRLVASNWVMAHTPGIQIMQY